MSRENEVIQLFTGKTLIGSRLKEGITFIEQIGHGATSIVFLAKSSLTLLAAKIIYVVNETCIDREVNINKMIDQDITNIVKLHDYFQWEEYFIFVFEYCKPGSLYDYCLNNRSEFNEELCIQLIKDVIKGYAFLYSNSVWHRDIKSGNIMLTKIYGQLTAKLGDFGYSRNIVKDVIKPGSKLTNAGTVEYMSPEMLDNKKYDYKTDIFSIGVVFFEMLFGYYPMDPLTRKSERHLIYKFYEAGVITVDTSHVSITKHSLDFISKCLQFKIDNRISIQDLVKHPMLTEEYTNLKENPFKGLTASIIINTL